MDWLVTAMPSVACSPCPPTWSARRPPTSEPVAARLPSASELAECLPDWTKTIDRAVSPDYACLKEAAIALAGASERARRSLVEAYDQAYCQIWLPLPPDYCAAIGGGWHDTWFGDGAHTTRSDQPKASGMYLLLRVVFALPMRYPAGTAQKFSGFVTPRDNPPEKDAVPPTEPYLSWPVREDPDAHVLWIERCLGYRGTTYVSVYHAIDEYDHVSFAHFPMRTRAQIEALEIKLVDDVPPVPRREVPPRG